MKLPAIPKKELARSQLNVALRLYMAGEEYPSVITLAGAAEEILGKVVSELGLKPALKRALGELLEAHRTIWGQEAKETDYAQLRTRARNEMKHRCSGADVSLDYEKESAQLISRALENYLLCFGSPHPEQQQFTKKRVSSWRTKQNAAV
jgi:hypothetical protein